MAYYENQTKQIKNICFRLQLFCLMEDDTQETKFLFTDLNWKLVIFNLKLEGTLQKSQFTFEQMKTR